MRRSNPRLGAATTDTSSIPWSSEWTTGGVIATLEPLVLPARRQRIEEIARRRIDAVTLVMDAPHDPHNAAAMLRSCEAFGVHCAHVVLREQGFRASRAVARGTERWVRLRVHPSPQLAVQALRARGYTIVAAHPRGELVPGDLPAVRRLALLMGNEHDGLREELAGAADESVRIPMRGFVESLNVSVSAALLLEAATRDRPGDLSTDERTAFYARGLYLSAPRAADVLAASTPR